MIYTIGHSTRTLPEFLALLARERIQTLADVRHYPGSRRCPWFGRQALGASLPKAGVAYEWIEDLGGYRKAGEDFPLTPYAAHWRHSSFRNYAQYTITSVEFTNALRRLMAISRESRTCIMCSEAVWWRSHRRIITDHLLWRHVPVAHIMDARTEPATLTKFDEPQPELESIP